MAANTTSSGSRFLALVLMVGGVLGIGVACVFALRFLRVHWIYGLLVAAFLWLFVWSALTGYRLWRNEARGWKWALILFAMQIPVLTVPGLSYEYYTGIALRLLGGHADKAVTL